ncbi:MAG TPA: carboxypeptidase-like regulatory domain-containing protein [Vicinamibacterales bacterium]|nr:carboxypeptidase-like regulatory domain-containing protein [Vicinamibacterales bacterium]
MRQLSWVWSPVSSIVLIGLLAACDGDRRPVVGPTTSGPTTPGPATSSIVAVEITGPQSIPPGQSAQFTAMSRFSDGSREPVTNHQWVFSNDLVRVDASGRATAGDKNGEGMIRVRVTTSSGWVDGSRTVLVLPERTYRVIGKVTEEANPAMPIVGARLELNGDGRVATLTDSDGSYKLYGVPAGGEIRVTRDGYRTHVERLEIADHAVRDFQLALSGARLDLSGSYTLAIDVDCHTSTPVRPPELRHRSYAALLTQTGSAVEVVLTESSRFRVNSTRRGDRFKGHADAVGATFFLQGFFSYYYPYDPAAYPDLLERIPDGTFLQIDGTAVARSTPDGLSGDLAGGVAHYSSGFPQVAPGAGGTLGVCWSRAHRFTLTRR